MNGSRKPMKSMHKKSITNTTANTLNGLTDTRVRDLPLLAAGCHLPPENPEMPEPRMPTPAIEPSKLAAAEARAHRSGSSKRQSKNHAHVNAQPQLPLAATDPGPLSVAKMQSAIRSWQDVDPRVRANWSSAVATVERMIHAVEAEQPPPVGIDRWSCAYLNGVLWVRPAEYFGITPKTLTSVISSVRQVLIRFGRHADAGPRRNELSPSWASFYAALPTEERQRGLIRFLRFLTLEGVGPDAVTSDLLDRFELWLRTRTLTENVPSLVRKAASNWLWACRNVSGWPDVELSRPKMRDHYSAPIEAMPEAFQADVAKFLDGLRGGSRGNPYRSQTVRDQAAGEDVLKRGRRRTRAVSPATIAHRKAQLRVAVAALEAAGIPRDTIISLRDVVTPADRPETIIQFHLDRLKARQGPRPDRLDDDEPTSTHVAGLAELLRIVAVHHVKLPEDEIEAILDIAASVRMPAQREMNETVARKLRALNEPDVQAILFYLADDWLRRIPKLNLAPVDAAREAGYAVALEIALTVPLRRRNLVGLHRDRHLVRDRRTGKVSGLAIPATATKTRRRGIVWDLLPRVAEMIEQFEREYLPALAEEGNRFLFPGLNGNHRDLADFATELCRRVERDIGADFNLHLVRHLTAYRVLKRHPGAYELVSIMLGHASSKTTREYYCGLEMIFAVREATRLLELDRIEARPSRARVAMAQQRLRTRRRKSGPPPAVGGREGGHV